MSLLQKALIFGKGQVGGALSRQLGSKAVTLDQRECNFLTITESGFTELLSTHQPQAVINAAAYTAVDAAEGEDREAALRINGEAVGMLARAAASLNIPLVHYSTDYVFDGHGETPWRETDATHPLNIYGASKLAGEKALAEAGGNYLLFRICWVYNEKGKNFFNTMLRLGAERQELQIVADQVGAPCYASDIASATLAALEKALNMPEFPSGIYHMCNGGEISWHGFAEAIFELAATYVPLQVQRVVAIPTSAYPMPAKRPLNSRLNCEKLSATFGLQLPHWQDALKRCVRNKYAR